MIVYHWFNYFIGPQSNIYKYLRFLTPSFIFIAGFIVANIYLAKYDIRHVRLPARLAGRGLKIIAIFVVLNAITGFLLPAFGSNWQLPQMLVRRFLGTTAPGVKDAAFSVLMPIGQLLLLSAALVFAYRFSRHVVTIVCMLAFAAVILLKASTIQNMNVDLIAIGLLGMVLGMIPLPRLIGVINRPVILAVAYVMFDLAVHYWGEPYLLQVIGVCLSVAIIYLVGASRWADNRAGTIVVLLGKYSLFGYISQIAILQVLRRTVTMESPSFRITISFIIAVVLTTWSVQLLDAARRSSPAMDRCYKLIFA
jgi:peptidoglycan/LPS O-acetylase OafA/YrhL